MYGYADERVMRWGDLEPGVDWLQRPFYRRGAGSQGE